jgi:hypothetical protein
MDVERRQAQLPPKSYNFHRRLRRYICSLPIRVQRFLRFGPVITRGLSLDSSKQGMSRLICGAPPDLDFSFIPCPQLQSKQFGSGFLNLRNESGVLHPIRSWSWAGWARDERFEIKLAIRNEEQRKAQLCYSGNNGSP